MVVILQKAMKAQMGKQGYSSTLSLNQSLDGWAVNSTPRRFTLRKET